MVKIPPQIEAKLAHLPDQPGIYIWKDAKGEVIYVGKSLNLHKRIKSYLTDTDKDPKTARLVAHIADLEYIITNSESEAFLLEANLIKQYLPTYNILLKDDKRYPFLAVTLQEPFPRVMVTREHKKDGSRYFGPYTETKSLRRTLRLLEWVFPLRSCKRTIPEGRIAFKRACINYQLQKCPAPCIGMISKEDYAVLVRRVVDFFSGRYQELVDEYRQEMLAASEAMQFEQAARLRDRILEIERIQKRQSVYYPDQRNLDIIGFYQEEQYAVVVVLRMINGKILHQEHYPLAQTEHYTPAEILSAFLKLHYAERDELPDEILLSHAPDDFEQLNLWLKKRLSLPQKGEKAKLIVMAKRNAFHLAEEHKLAHLRKANRTIVPIQELKEKLHLPKLPRKMVCMDISTIQGTDTVSSAVFFENGKPVKKYYRHFIIRSIDTQNDYAAIGETMSRFLTETDKVPEMLPDLFIIDGGKGQLHTAESVLKTAGKTVPLISLAKRLEEIFLPQTADSLLLAKSSQALRLITKIRDEAHRFAINFHRSRRSKRTLISELEAIPGIGEQTKFLLLKQFGSVDAIRQCTAEQLAEVKGIGVNTARLILAQLKQV